MLSAAENAGTTPEALAVQLLTAIFTDEELQTGNCTKPRKSGIVQLDQVKIKAIRGMCIILICTPATWLTRPPPNIYTCMYNMLRACKLQVSYRLR